MTSGSHTDLFSVILEESTVELFENYNTPVQNHEWNSEEELEMGFVGILGFTGDEVRGTLMISIPTDIVRSHCGIIGEDPIPRSIARDWTGELANQLLGRVKNKLFSYNATIFLSTPVTLTGQRIVFLSSDSQCAIGPLLFRYEDECVCLWFEYEVNEDHVWEIDGCPDREEHAAEGELLFF